jgi:hypothetical protein
MASLYNLNTGYTPFIWLTPYTFTDLADDSDPDIGVEITANFEVQTAGSSSSSRPYTLNDTALKIRNYMLLFLNYDTGQMNTLLGELKRHTAMDWNAYFATPYQLCISHVLALESGFRKISREFQATTVKRSPGSENIARHLLPEFLALEVDDLEFPMDNEDGDVPQ